MISNEILIWLIPVALAIILVAVVSLENLLLITLFFTPLSVQLSYLAGETAFDLSLPTEPILAMLLLVTLFKMITTREFSIKLLRHPITIILGLYLLWTGISAATSNMPLVSFKTLAYRLWFISGFYLIAAQLFCREGFSRKYILAYSAGMVLVVLYFLVRVEQAGLLNQRFAHSACFPFFKDHTSFGASIAFLLPPLVAMLFAKTGKVISRLMLASLIILFMAAFIFSYSRAAWVSLIVAFAAIIILYMRLPKRILFLITAGLVIGLVLSAGWIFQKMDSTTEDSSADLAQHLRSSSNITTDQSNLERINRWKCALKMFAEKPLLGWGAGTYQFNYGPFQRPEDRTIISTDFGDAGNAHSEYLGALSETGLPGAILFLLISVSACLAGIRVWYREKRSARGYFALAVLAGLLTYMVHGIMNSFLDSDKIASLWWGYIAIIVAMDLEKQAKRSVVPRSGSAGRMNERMRG